MANNRLLLRCIGCGAELPLARLQVGMGHEWLPARVTDDEREAWYREHSSCGHGQGLFVALVSENDRALSLVNVPLERAEAQIADLEERVRHLRERD